MITSSFIITDPAARWQHDMAVMRLQQINVLVCSSGGNSGGFYITCKLINNKDMASVMRSSCDTD
jgi:hypothetical protein